MTDAAVGLPPDIEEARRRRRRRRHQWRLVATGFLLLILLLVAIIWSQRLEIATSFINRELERRGVQASYRVTRVGFRTQRLEQLVIGDPRQPDLTARWVEVDLSIGLRQPRVEKITARGVRMRGRFADGKIRLGEIDKLLPPPTGAPFRLPNQRIDIADASLRLDTPAGRVGIALEGSGNLAYSFEGRLAASAPRLVVGDCRIEAPRLLAALRTEEEEPTLTGPLRAERVACGGVQLSRPRLALRTTLRPGFDGGEGEAGVEVARLASGQQSLRDLTGDVSFTGDSDRIRGAVNLAAASALVGGHRSGRTAIEGRYALAPRAGNVSLMADISASNVTAASGNVALAEISSALGAADGTPIDPIGDALAASLKRAGQAFDARGGIRFVNGAGYSAIRVERLRAVTHSGAILALSGGTGLSYYWPAGAARIDGNLAITGGGFPNVQISLDQDRAGAAIEGEARIGVMAAGGARLQLAPVRFTAGGGGSTRIETVALIDGPFNDGRVAGLLVPVRGRISGDGGFVFGERCTTIGFRSLEAAGLSIGPTRLPFCPTGRALLWRDPGRTLMAAAEVNAPRISGRLGRTPVGLAAGRLRFSLAEPGFTGSNVSLRLGGEGHVNRFEFATLAGRFNKRGVIGSFAGGDVKLANVPLMVSEARGDWSVLGGDLVMNGALRVADEADPARFYPLVSNDFRLTLDGSRIEAGGWLVDPENEVKVSRVAIEHSLKAGSGKAVLDVPGIRFDENYQPEELTPLTTGVVALVNGTVTGRGEIGWGPEGTTSSGSFSTENMSLAATFGPVEGLTTTVNFTDLLGLVTAPGQLAEVGVVRTGIDVFDGRVRYQLLPELKVRVEGGRWPFAGGELLLEETILDFSRPSPKNLTFRVVGVDAAIFVQQMEFTNISATGTFDGVIPMTFDERGGRIVAGRVEARADGGNLSYIGELTDKQLGYYGKLAFDALKSMRYQKLTIDLDGALEGEFLASIELDGIARNAPTPGGIVGRVLSQLAKIPFEFNIRVRGPFRALLATTRSLEDPTLLIQSVLPEILQDKPTTTSVQPEESETVQ